MAEQLTVQYQGRPVYPIHIEPDYSRLGKCLRRLEAEGRRALIITDRHVAPLYLEEIRGIFSGYFRSTETLILEPGEAQKNTESISRIYEKAIECGFDRNDFFAALGGGVCGDMTGFAAASYMRGIRFIQLPTTLLSQVDSSIGGKTGVDFRQYKNMIGAFHMPALVYSSVSALKTLETEQYASGMGEVIKHAFIRSRDYLHFLLEGEEALRERETEALIQTVFQSNLIKQAVVEEDPREKGVRKILNFGHTLGHAIESCSGFSYTHGQCVAFGCLAALRLSGLEYFPERPAVLSFMRSMGLEETLQKMDTEEILRSTKMDKKMDKGQIHFVLLREIGEAYISDHVTERQMRDALLSIMEH